MTETCAAAPGSAGLWRRSGGLWCQDVLGHAIADDPFVVHSPGATALAGLKAALLDADRRLVVIVAAGDSIVQGANSTENRVESYVGEYRRVLQAKYGDGGSGFLSVNNCTEAVSTPGNYIAFTGDWTPSAGGVGARILTGVVTGMTLTFPGVRGRKLKVHYIGGTGTGLIDVLINGVPFDTFGTQLAATAVGIKSWDVPISGAYTVTLRITGAVVIAGVEATNPTGVVVHNMAAAGAVAASYTTVVYPTLSRTIGQHSIEDYRPDALVYVTGINDATFAVALATYQAGVQAAVDYAQAGNPAVSLIGVWAHTMTFNLATYANYRTRFSNVWTAEGGWWQDVWARGEESASHMSDRGYVVVGEVHPTNLGHEYVDQPLSMLAA